MRTMMSPTRTQTARSPQRPTTPEMHEIGALETKRADDVQHMRELESLLTEAMSFVAICPKL